MRFLMVAEELWFNRLPRQQTAQQTQKKANRQDGNQFVLSLFEFVAEDELNELENKVATYLDKQERLFFWYRNRTRRDYYVQRWKRHPIFADFNQGASPEGEQRYGIQADSFRSVQQSREGKRVEPVRPCDEK